MNHIIQSAAFIIILPLDRSSSANNYSLHRAVYKKYQQQKPSEQEAFYERHRAELMLCEAARRYLKQVLNGQTTVPIKEWKAEAATLADEKATLYAEYKRLKEEVRDVEVIQRCVERTVGKIEPSSRIRKEESIE